jgi:hypothetical protein
VNMDIQEESIQEVQTKVQDIIEQKRSLLA